MLQVTSDVCEFTVLAARAGYHTTLSHHISIAPYV